MISLTLERKRFGGEQPATLASIQLSVEAGEFIALLGPSGVGKTTLLRILAGLDGGFDGSLQRSGEHGPIGFLFQEARLMPWLTAVENVALVAGGDATRAQAALEEVDLGDAGDRYPHQLSGGMQRRVALARAIVARPHLLLLDEPFVSLDQPSASALQDLLLRYCRRERPTVVLVSHNLDEAACLADRLVFLGDSPATIIHEQAVSIPRPRSPSEAPVRELCAGLLGRHPQLLSGVLGQSD